MMMCYIHRRVSCHVVYAIVMLSEMSFPLSVFVVCWSLHRLVCDLLLFFPRHVISSFVLFYLHVGDTLSPPVLVCVFHLPPSTLYGDNVGDMLSPPVLVLVFLLRSPTLVISMLVICCYSTAKWMILATRSYHMHFAAPPPDPNPSPIIDPR